MGSVCPAVPAATLSPGCPPPPTMGSVLAGKLSDRGDTREAVGGVPGPGLGQSTPQTHVLHSRVRTEATLGR